MDEHNQPMLPMVREVTVGESALRALERKAAEADSLRAEVGSLRARLAHAHREIDGANHFLGALLIALDDLERAESAARASSHVHAITDGVTLVRRALTDALAQAAVREIAVAVGDSFDPERHDHAPGGPAVVTAHGVVSAVLRRGFEREGEVVRRAVVEVEWEAR